MKHSLHRKTYLKAYHAILDRNIDEDGMWLVTAQKFLELLNKEIRIIRVIEGKKTPEFLQLKICRVLLEASSSRTNGLYEIHNKKWPPNILFIHEKRRGFETCAS